MTEEESKLTKIYHYHPETNEFIGQTPAKLDPLEGKVLVPAHATIVEVYFNDVGENETYVFNGNDWILTADFRNKTFYKEDGSSVTIDKLGELPDVHWSTDAPEPPEPPELTYAQKRKQEYPNIGDQLDEIMKWFAEQESLELSDGLQSIVDLCMSVKEKHPKPKQGE